MAGLIQLNKVFALGTRSLSMHPYIWNKLMSMHLKLHVNVSRSELLFLPGHQQDTSVSKISHREHYPSYCWRNIGINFINQCTLCEILDELHLHVVHLEGCIDMWILSYWLNIVSDKKSCHLKVLYYAVLSRIEENGSYNWILNVKLTYVA